MKKNINYFLSLLFILFSCTTNQTINNKQTKYEQIKQIEKKFIEEPIDNNEELEEYEEEYEENYEDEYEDDYELDDFIIPTEIDNDLSIYQQLAQQVKKVELKKTIIKPLTDIRYTPHEFTNEEVEDFLINIEKEGQIDESKKYQINSIKYLMDNYKNILKTSSVCCVSSISNQLKENGIQGEELLTILKDDASDYFVQENCIIVSNKDVKDMFEDKSFVNIILNSRSNCICKNKEF